MLSDLRLLQKLQYPMRLKSLRRFLPGVPYNLLPSLNRLLWRSAEDNVNHLVPAGRSFGRSLWIRHHLHLHQLPLLEVVLLLHGGGEWLMSTLLLLESFQNDEL